MWLINYALIDLFGVGAYVSVPVMHVCNTGMFVWASAQISTESGQVRVDVVSRRIFIHFVIICASCFYLSDLPGLYRHHARACYHLPSKQHSSGSTWR